MELALPVHEFLNRLVRTRSPAGQLPCPWGDGGMQCRKCQLQSIAGLLPLTDEDNSDGTENFTLKVAKRAEYVVNEALAINPQGVSIAFFNRRDAALPSSRGIALPSKVTWERSRDSDRNFCTASSLRISERLTRTNDSRGKMLSQSTI